MDALIPDEARTDREVRIQAGDLEPQRPPRTRHSRRAPHDLRPPAQRQQRPGNLGRPSPTPAQPGVRAGAGSRPSSAATETASEAARSSPRRAQLLLRRASSVRASWTSARCPGEIRCGQRRLGVPLLAPAPRSAGSVTAAARSATSARAAASAARPRASGCDLHREARQPALSDGARARAARSRAPRLPPSSTGSQRPRLTTHGDGCCGPATWCSALASTPGPDAARGRHRGERGPPLRPGALPARPARRGSRRRAARSLHRAPSGAPAYGRSQSSRAGSSRRRARTRPDAALGSKRLGLISRTGAGRALRRPAAEDRSPHGQARG